jgi:hypothetical protein
MTQVEVTEEVMRIELAGRMTLEELQDFHRLVAKRSPLIVNSGGLDVTRVMGLLLLVPLLGFPYYLTVKKIVDGNGEIGHWLFVIGLPVAAAFFCMLPVLVLVLRWRAINVKVPRHYREHPEHFDWQFVIDDLGIALKSNAKQSASTWDDLTRWEVYNDLVILTVDTGQSPEAIRSSNQRSRGKLFYALPRRFFVEGQLDDFIQFLQTRRPDSGSTASSEINRAPTTTTDDRIRPADNSVMPPVKEAWRDTNKPG